ncbi:CRISPR-associated endonuclease Cas2 [Candidatus Gottesmanbacteria bacterium]|nr:CRISPR-associated endonuclease Cas2 [Candidatus Gottesmanbacteria bacterium]
MAIKNLDQAYIPFPSDETLRSISLLLVKQSEHEQRKAKYAPIKEVLSLIGRGAVISSALLSVSGAASIAKLLRESPDWDSWKRYNVSYLQRTLRRLAAQKHVEVSETNDMSIVSLTKLGKRKILKYSQDTIKVDKPDHWDRKWRLVMYDIPSSRRELSEVLRQALRTLGFYKMQESVYVYPYPCFEQIEFLREFYALGDIVQYMLVDKIENDEAYKIYFGLS